MVLQCHLQQGLRAPKKHHKTCSKAYPRVDLNDMDSLEPLAWAVHDWQWIIVGTTLRLIYQGATAEVHCPPHAQSLCTTLRRLIHGKVPRSTLGGSSPEVLSHLLHKGPQPSNLVNVLRAALSLSTEGVPAASLDDCKEDDREEIAFHQFYWQRVQQNGMWKKAASPPCQVMHASPSKSCQIDQMCQTTKWLLNCETSLEEEEISWWPLVSPLTGGSDAATKDLTKRLMAAWKWVG